MDSTLSDKLFELIKKETYELDESAMKSSESINLHAKEFAKKFISDHFMDNNSSLIPFIEGTIINMYVLHTVVIINQQTHKILGFDPCLRTRRLW